MGRQGEGSDAVRVLEERTTSTALVVLRSDDIVRVTITAPVQTREAALENVTTMQALRGERRVGLLIDVRNESRGEKAALDVYAGAECARGVVGQALLIDSPLSVVMGNFFMRINRPLNPTRLFGDEKGAVAWLYELLAAAAATVEP